MENYTIINGFAMTHDGYWFLSLNKISSKIIFEKDLNGFLVITEEELEAIREEQIENELKEEIDRLEKEEA